MNAKIDIVSFYALSFTWGLPLTLIGCVVALVLMALGYKPKKWDYCWYFEVGEGWGGLELGVFFLKDKSVSDRIPRHETGHAIQNCYFGPLMIFLVCIPSAIRYWWRELFGGKGSYDDIWFEGQATRLGTELHEWLNDGR